MKLFHIKRIPKAIKEAYQCSLWSKERSESIRKVSPFLAYCLIIYQREEDIGGVWRSEIVDGLCWQWKLIGPPVKLCGVRPSLNNSGSESIFYIEKSEIPGTFHFTLFDKVTGSKGYTTTLHI